VVLSLRAQEGVVDAVASLREQVPEPEVVVVNSGGGDPTPALAARWPDVRVVNSADRLLPGAARNAGIAATHAPLVAFLAADCRAEPGWVAGRLRAHRAGATAVASVVTNLHPDSVSARAAHLLMYQRRMAETPAAERLLYGVSYERRLLERHGAFRPDLRQGEDSELNSRVGAIAWAGDVRTAHDNPTSPAALLRDQFERGRRGAGASPLATGFLLRRALLHRPASAWRQAWRAPRGRDRRALLGATPLLPAAAAARAAGILVARRGARTPRRAPAATAPGT
jgi:glycosyltransferase involved in cell wall biosynthesis